MGGEGSMAHAIKSMQENRKLRPKPERGIFTKTLYLRDDVKPCKKSKPLTEEEKKHIYEKYVLPLKRARRRQVIFSLIVAALVAVGLVILVTY